MLYFGSQMVKNRTGWPARWALPRILVFFMFHIPASKNREKISIFSHIIRHAKHAMH